MADIAMCAYCGEEKELCRSVRIDGIQQPRPCKECLIILMSNDPLEHNDLYWLIQLGQLSDPESIERLKQLAMEKGG